MHSTLKSVEYLLLVKGLQDLIISGQKNHLEKVPEIRCWGVLKRTEINIFFSIETNMEMKKCKKSCRVCVLSFAFLRVFLCSLFCVFICPDHDLKMLTHCDYFNDDENKRPLSCN